MQNKTIEVSANGSGYPLRVAYDAKAFIESDLGTGKGAQLRTLLGEMGLAFTGLAPRSPRASKPGLPLIQRGTHRYLIWQQTTLPRLLAEIKPDVFLAPYNTAPLRIPAKTKLVSVVHDLILLESFSDAPLQRRLRDGYRAMLLQQAIRRSSVILTVSQFSADEIKQRYPGSKPRVIHCTVAPSWYVRDQVVPHGERKNYVLMVTSNATHKNVPLALEAFARYKSLDPESTVTLRMAGVSSSLPHFKAMAERLNIGASVLVEPFLTEPELQSLYRHALCVLLPSRMEGFGIPALEAMSSGTPLLSSNTWSLPEVGGDAPIYFDPTNLEEIAQSLLAVCCDPALRTRLINAGLERAEKFHPDRIRAEVSTFWREVPEQYSSW